jgi:hypothetical protein
MLKYFAGVFLALAWCVGVVSAESGAAKFEYRLLATNRTTTMEREMNLAAAEGYYFRDVRSGETAFGGDEAVVIMERSGGAKAGRYSYQLLATSKTSTMQKELQAAGDRGFNFRGTTVFKKVIGREVVVILERDGEAKADFWDFKLLATNRTGTMQKELAEASRDGYEFVGFSVGETAFGGNEVVSILRRARN